MSSPLDPNRPCLSGLLVRFDEGFSDAISFLNQIDPDFAPPQLPANSPLSEKASHAAHGETLSIAVKAMRLNGKLLVNENERALFDGAIGIAYALFIFILLRSYLKNENIEIEAIPIHTSLSDLFVWLDTVEREELATKGISIFQEMIESKHPKVVEWHDELSKAVHVWLISANSDKRTPENDALVVQLFSELLTALYKAVD